MPTISGNSDLSVNAPKRLRRCFGMTGWILALALVFVSKSAFSQDKKDKLDPQKSLHEVAVKLYENTATEAEYLFLQNLYRSTSNASNKRYVLSLAAQYQRQVLKNPVKTLELVLPQLIAKQELATWSKGQEKISRSRNVRAEDYVQNLENLPDVTEWRVAGSRGLLALEAAHALFALKLNEDSFALMDSVGRNNNDHVRVLTAEIAAECYIKNEEYKKAKEVSFLHRNIRKSYKIAIFITKKVIGRSTATTGL